MNQQTTKNKENEQDTKTLTGKEIRELIIKGFIKDLMDIKIGGINLFKSSTPKYCVVSPDIELTDLNNFLRNKGGGKVNSFVEFLSEMYATSTTRLIKKYLPYPVNEKVKMLPVLSFSPNPENPKFIQFSF